MLNSRNPFVRTVKQGTLSRLISISRHYPAAVLTKSTARIAKQIINFQYPYHVRQTGATSEAHPMSYNCEVSKNLFSTCPTWSFLMFSLVRILGALISFLTAASCGIIINWVLDFSQSFLHSNRQRTNTPEVFRLG